MIVRRRTPWRVAWDFFRAFASTSDTRLPELPIASAAQFQKILAKEISRCQRRPAQLEFAVVKLQFDWQRSVLATQQLVRSMQDRLRITDEIGWWEDEISVLLPETDREGAHVVANWLMATGHKLDLSIATEVLMYPWDDPIGGKSSELWSQRDMEATAEGAPQPAGISSEAKQTTAAPLFLARPLPSAMPFWKRAIDLFGASLGLLLFAPLFLGIAILIRRDSAGPALFVQWREGRGGKPFKMYKFRTMHNHAELLQFELRNLNQQDGPAFKIDDDPRVTKVGRWLRKTGLDELPQLWNVLLGNMSLVGPRPLPLWESERCALWHRDRLNLVPGITGIWQTRGGRQVSFDEWMRMDREYARRLGLMLDLKLIGATIWKAVRRRASV